MSFTGNYISAEQAERWGLVNRVVSPDVLMGTCMDLARDIASSVQDVVTGYKGLIDGGLRTTLGEGLRLEQEAYVAHARRVKGHDVGARRNAVLERGRRQKEE
jgi:enoyl-CoA hydratase